LPAWAASAALEAAGNGTHISVDGSTFVTNVVGPDDLRCRAVVVSGPHRWQTSLFKERLIYEQSAPRTVREQQEKRPSGLSRQQLKIEQLTMAANLNG
jgi:hypothetical protein